MPFHRNVDLPGPGSALSGHDRKPFMNLQDRAHIFLLCKDTVIFIPETNVRRKVPSF